MASSRIPRSALRLNYVCTLGIRKLVPKKILLRDALISFTMKTELDLDSSLIPRSLAHGILDREIAFAYRTLGQERSP